MDTSNTDLVKHESGHGSGALASPEAHAPQIPSYNPDAPSEEWGWHGNWRVFANKGSKVLLGILTLVIFLLLIGNHVSKVENYWVILIGLGMLTWMVVRERDAKRVRNNARRKKIADPGQH